jgi:S-DNA-T family DNA segregation ATPase FtsK/SpoIIIE
MEFLKSQNKGSAYDEEALEEINRAAQKCAKGGKGGDDDDGEDGDDSVGIFNDPKFIEAVEIAIRQGKIATSLLQRKLGIGFGRAARYIDAMQDQNFVSEPNGQKPREVLITKEEWHEILSRRSLD